MKPSFTITKYPYRGVQLQPMISNQGSTKGDFCDSAFGSDPLRCSTSAPTSNSNSTSSRTLFTILPEKTSNLDSVQIQKLQRLYCHGHGTHGTHLKEIPVRESKKILQIRSFEALKEEEFRKRRQEMSQDSLLNQYANTGDESNLRQELTDGDYNVNERDPLSGRTLLIAAIVANQDPIVHILVCEFKVDLRRKSLLSESTPLHFAVSSGNRQITLFLLTYGAKVNARNKYGCSPLHLASSLSLTKLLLKHGADPLMRSLEVFHFVTTSATVGFIQYHSV
jgi:hypothetical protein